MTVTPIRKASDNAADKPDDRAGIKQAIDARIDAEHALDRHRAAIGRAREHADAAAARVEKATAAVVAAREAEGAALAKLARTAANLSPRSPAGSGLREARVSLLECEDNLEASRAAVSKLEAELAELEQRILVAKGAVIAAVNALIAGPAAAALERARKAKAIYLINRESFWAIVSGAANQIPDIDNWSDLHRARDAAELPLRDLFSAGNTFFGNGLGVDPDQFAVNSRIAEAWRRWRSELLTDADAKMPVLPE